MAIFNKFNGFKHRNETNRTVRYLVAGVTDLEQN